MVSTKKSLKKNAKAQCVIAANIIEPTQPLLKKLSTVLVHHLSFDGRDAQSTTDNIHSKPLLLLALSGGLDSTVLLHLLAALRQNLSFSLQAMHVHHGLSPHANDWTEFCIEQCKTLEVPLHVEYVNIEPKNKSGIEAAARKLRYQAFFNFKHADLKPDFIVTAHHQDDQAETLLLQLFRGAGVKGLASMAKIDEQRRLLRPLLDVSRSDLHDYARLNGLTWCDDESNLNTNYERNFVRHHVMPVLLARNPSIQPVIARVATHLAEADGLLDALAEIDASQILSENSLCLVSLEKLERSRAKNLLRWWLARNQLSMPNAEYLSEILHQLFNAKPDANINIPLRHHDVVNSNQPPISLRRYQQRVYLVSMQASKPFDLTWHGEPLLTLPNRELLEFRHVTGRGLALKHGLSELRITRRSGGETFKPHALRPSRTLKHLLQEAHIPPWLRDSLPLIYWHDKLVFVPGIGVAHDMAASHDEPAVEIIWHLSQI